MCCKVEVCNAVWCADGNVLLVTDDLGAIFTHSSNFQAGFHYAGRRLHCEEELNNLYFRDYKTSEHLMKHS